MPPQAEHKVIARATGLLIVLFFTVLISMLYLLRQRQSAVDEIVGNQQEIMKRLDELKPAVEGGKDARRQEP